MEAFLRRVLPDGGDYVVMVIDPRRPGEPPGHVNGIKTVGAMTKAIQRLSQQPVNLYFAVGTYDRVRLGANARAKRTLYLDLDAKDFGDKQAAAKELGLFLRTTGFPAPGIVVDSGGGLHCYWPFDRDLPAAEWRVLAGKLKARCIDAGFKADNQCTDDLARVLRIPGTLNYKYGTPVACRVLTDKGATFDPAVLDKALTPAQPPAAAILAGTGDDLALPTGAASVPQVPYYGVEIGERCGVMKEAMATGGADHTEPLWSNLLSLLTFCEDGAVMVPLVSQGHPGYDPSKCGAKFEYKVKRKAEGQLKPVLCDTFAQYKGSICMECPHRGHIKTPLVLGRQEAVNFLPFGYVMKPGGIYKIKKGATPEEPDTVIRVFPYAISEVDLIRNGAGYAVKATYSGKTNIFRTEVPLVMFGKQTSDLIETLMQSGVIVSGTQLNELKNIMTNWLQRLQDIKQTARANTTNLGWGTRGGDFVFAAGDSIFHRDGKAEKFTHAEVQLLHDYEPSGKRSEWDDAAAVVLDGRQAIVAAVLTAFAAPLLHFTAASGITFSLSSVDSGTGKTTALKLAQAVWGSPTRAMAMLNDTQNSVMKKMGFIKNLPAYWDEVRAEGDFDSFIYMIFQISQGKEKSRLTAAVKQQEMGTWQTMAVLATNERIADHMDRVVKESDAGRCRVFEVQVPKIKGKTDNAIQRKIAKLEHSYGQVRQQYAKFLAANRTTIEKLVHAMSDRVVKDLNATPEERFWVAFVTVELAAARIVNAQGYLKIDIDTFQAWLYAEFMKQRQGISRNVLSMADAAVDCVLRFVDVNREYTLVTEHGGGGAGYGAVLIQPLGNKPVKILMAKKDHKLRFTEREFKQWLVNQGRSPSIVFNELDRSGSVRRKKASISGGLANTTNARYPCFEVDLTKPAFAGLLEDQ